MQNPAVWNADPECGHRVAHAYQTHYCTYIRVPRLLTLQDSNSSDERFLITALQWYELWFKVLLTDLRAALREDGSTFEPIKLLRRGVELYKLFFLHADLCDAIITRDLALKKSLRDATGRGISNSFAEILILAGQLARRWRNPPVELVEAVREYRAQLDAFRARYEKFLRATLIRKPRAPTYANWLHVNQLLGLQGGIKSAWTEEGKSPHGFRAPAEIGADETMFIVVHQCFELWFQIILDHLDRAIPLLQRAEIRDATRLVRRVTHIQRLLVQQIQIPATMLPLDFAKFRGTRETRAGKIFVTGLSPASGTESYQFREIEIVCGLRDDPAFQHFLEHADVFHIQYRTPRHDERFKQMTLPEAFHIALRARGIARVENIFRAANEPNPHADLMDLADTLLAFDEFFRAWRIAHLTMVEKMIGGKSGTGFLGPEYLMETAGIRVQEKNRVFQEPQVRPRFFEELWRVRTRLGNS